MSLKISVIICTRNRIEDFKNTLTSLLKQKRLPDELVIVDSSDTTMLADYLNSINLPIDLNYIHSDPGLTLQRNVGVRNSQGDLLFFLDDDCELDMNYLVNIENVFLRDENYKLGAVGGRLENLFGNVTNKLRLKIDRIVFGLISIVFGLPIYGNGRFRLSGMATFPHHLYVGRFIECLSGGLMAFRKEVFQKVGFDENLEGYGLMEDWSISKNTIDAGYLIYYEPSASLIHKESSQNRFDYSRWAEMFVVNYDYLFQKNWRRDWYRIPFYYWALLGVIVFNFHNKDARQGTFRGLKKVFSK